MELSDTITYTNNRELSDVWCLTMQLSDTITYVNNRDLSEVWLCSYLILISPQYS
jgi:hypothetical protein